MLHSTKSTNFS